LSPAEIQEVITGLSGKPEKLFADGLHVAGERYVLTKAEDRSLYARKVGSLFLPPIRLLPGWPRAMNLSASLRIWLTFLNTGQRRRCHCQDQDGYPHCPLQRWYDCGEHSNNGRATGRLSHQDGLLVVQWWRARRLYVRVAG
jgi:hypothetical protein